MYPQIIVSLLTCCSLVLGSVQPLNTLSSSEKSTNEPQSLILPFDEIATSPAASATASSRIVDDQYPDSPQAECESIVYGQTVDGWIDIDGETDCFIFTGQVNDLMYAQLASPDLMGIQLTLSGPGVTTQSCTSYGTCQIFYETLSASGVHVLTVSNLLSGYYTLYLGLLSAPPETITYGETVTGTISVAGEQDSYQFNGEAGDLSFTYINSPVEAEFYLKMFIPDGASRSCFSYDTCLIDEMTLPTTGIYTLIVGGSGSYTGDYSLTLGSTGPLSISIGETRNIAVTSGKPLTYQIDVPSGTDDLFITLQKVGIWNWNSKLELSSGNQVLESTESWNDQILHLPSPAVGTYYLEVTGSGEGKLSVLASLPELPLGQWVAGTIYTQFGYAWYQCDVPAGQDSLHFYVETLGLISQLDVYQNTIGGSPNWTANGAAMNLEIPSPTAGRYYVQLTDSAYVIGDSQERDHMIKADVLPIDPPACSLPVVSNFTPGKGGTYMPVTVMVSGHCFEQESSVCLTRQGNSDVCADTVVIDDDGRALSATFDLSTAEQGDWSLVVTNPDSQSATAPESFTVRSGGEPNLWVDITGREQYRIGRTQTYHVSYGNSGPVDTYDVLLFVKVPAAFEVSVDLPHPMDDTIDWDSIPSVVESGSEKVIPLWLFRVGADSQDGFDLSIKLSEGQIGDQVTITAELEHVASKFAQTGNLDDIKDSPVFFMLVESILESLETIDDTNTNINYSLLKAGTATNSFEDVATGLSQTVNAWWDHLAPKYTIIFAGIGLLAGLLIGGPVLGLVLTGATLGGLVDSAMSVFQFHKLVTIPVFRKLAKIFNVDLIDSTSPEDKYGPSGYDPPGTPLMELEHWIPADRMLDYRIDFWNKEDALAATVDVIISDTLDADLDWNTFYFTEIGFLDWQVQLQPTQYFNVDVANVSIDLSTYYPGEPVVDLVVNVEGTYDPSTGFIEWHFHALDPTTRQPPENPYAGFLPPITDSGWELGWVNFSVAQKAGLASGTVIQNQAFVKFDLNEFKPAPKEGPFTNTVDGTPPTSEAQVSSGHPQCNSFSVTWTGQDDLNGSGLQGVDLYVDDLGNSDPPYLWSGGLQSDSVIFSGVPGIAYSFYTRARDNVGNLEAIPDQIGYDALAAVHNYCLFTPMGMLDYK